LQEVTSSPKGAKSFAGSSQKSFNVVEIAYVQEGESIDNRMVLQ
jgi:hypothetical protein